MGLGDVTLTVRFNPKAKQIRAITLTDDVPPLAIAVIGNQLALRAIKEHGMKEIEKEQKKSTVIVPTAAESIQALNGAKDAVELQGGNHE
jgi:hypothetical protein